MSLDPADLTYDTVSQILSLCQSARLLGRGLPPPTHTHPWAIAKLPN